LSFSSKNLFNIYFAASDYASKTKLTKFALYFLFFKEHSFPVSLFQIPLGVPINGFPWKTKPPEPPSNIFFLLLILADKFHRAFLSMSPRDQKKPPKDI
jgi:hypothetical protein